MELLALSLRGCKNVELRRPRSNRSELLAFGNDRLRITSLGSSSRELELDWRDLGTLSVCVDGEIIKVDESLELRLDSGSASELDSSNEELLDGPIISGSLFPVPASGEAAESSSSVIRTVMVTEPLRIRLTGMSSS